MPRSRLELIRPVFLAFLISILNIACAQTKADKIDELFNLYSKYGQFNGSVLITDKTEIIYKKGFGFANMEWRIPNQTDTKFRLASVSKQFTAMLIVQLASENKIKLDAPISSYLPEYSKKTGDIINIHHLLTHSSGIPDYTSFPDFRERMGDSYTPEEIVKLFADSTLEFTPGEKFQYSNSGYILLGYIIEKITGKPYEQVLQEKIFSPLKMSNSGYYQNSEVIKSKAYGYDKSGNTYQNASYIDMSFPFSAGGIYSTVEDLYLWDQALYTEKLLPQKYMDLLFNKYIPSGDDEYYAYGWEIGKLPVGSTKEELETISHQGEINGFNTQILRIPSEKSLIVLLNNTGGAQLNEMSMAINGILHNKP
ncbi:MAG TPA: serine hydrolase domain-containing protein, partial [Saprospiraceae bacterium]|nr:serine hydrolase domain-containing protein [Saprospiraceae bacterium]